MRTNGLEPWAGALGLVLLATSVASADPAGRAALEATLRRHGDAGPFPVLHALGSAGDLDVDSGDVVAAVSATNPPARVRRLLSGVTSIRARAGRVQVLRLTSVELPFGAERGVFGVDVGYRVAGDDLVDVSGLSYGGATLRPITTVRRAAPTLPASQPAGVAPSATNAGLADLLRAPVAAMAPGARGEDVRHLQQLLNWDRRAAGSAPIGEDGQFGAETERALREFQARHGLPASGSVSPAAWVKLEAARPQGAPGSPLLQRGDRSSSVRSLQWLLNLQRRAAGQAVIESDGIFGDDTDRALRAFQRERGLPAHGVSDAATWAALRGAPSPAAPASTTPPAPAHPTLASGARGDEVRALQRRINRHREVLGLSSIGVDGVFGAETERALEDFQRRSGIAATGRADDATLRALNRDPVQPAAPATPNTPSADGSLRGLKVAIDAGHGMTHQTFDPGAVNRQTGVTEFEVNRQVAARVKQLLEARGAQVTLRTYPRGSARTSLYQKGAIARGHHVFVSVHHNSANKSAQGSMVLIHRDLATSQSQTLARAIQRELTAQLWSGAKRYDLGVRRQGLSVLRGAHAHVRAAVLVEGFFVDPADVTPTKAAGWIEAEARAIAAGVGAYWRQR